MQPFTLSIAGYVAYIILNSVIFIADAMAGQGGSGKIAQKFEFLVLILTSILIFTGTTGHLFKNFPKANKLILIILSMLATVFQVVVLVFVFFFFAMMVLSTILAKCGFYVTMP